MAGKFRSTYILLAVFLALLVYVVFGLQDGFESGTETGVKICEYPPDQIRQMDIRNKGEDVISVIAKDGGNWAITAPFAYPADEGTIKEVRTEFESLIADRMVEEKPEDLSVYGLDEPVFHITVYTASGESLSLYIGDRTPVGSGYYVKTDKDPVYVLNSNSVWNIRCRLEHLREKEIVHISPLKATKVVLKRPGKSELVVTRPDMDSAWQITSPVTDRAGDLEMSKLLWDFRDLEVDEFVDDSPQDLSEYGLDNPLLLAELGEGEKTIKIRVAKKKDGEYYVKTSERPNVFSVRTSVFRPLDLKPFDLVDKRLIRVVPDNLLSLRYADGETTVEMVKEMNTWKLASGETIPESTVDKVWDSLRNLEAIDLWSTGGVDDAGSVSISIILTGQGEDQIQVISIEGSDRYGYYLVSNERDGKYMLDPKNVKNLRSTMADLAH